MLKDAMFTGDPSVTAKDGTMSVEWSGVGKWV